MAGWRGLETLPVMIVAQDLRLARMSSSPDISDIFWDLHLQVERGWFGERFPYPAGRWIESREVGGQLTGACSWRISGKHCYHNP